MLIGELCFSKSVILDGEILFAVWCKFHRELRVILIKKNQENNGDKKRKTLKNHEKETRKKMPVFICPCGIKILIVPDLSEMTKAIANHLIEHKKITGQDLSEEALAQEIIIAIAQA
jgi:hypothetical protein